MYDNEYGDFHNQPTGHSLVPVSGAEETLNRKKDETMSRRDDINDFDPDDDTTNGEDEYDYDEPGYYEDEDEDEDDDE